MLEREGFEVTVCNRLGNIDIGKMMSGEMDPIMMASISDMLKPTTDFTEQYDAALIVANMETLSNEVDIRLLFDALGNDIPWFVQDIPTAFVSFANPYHLIDVQMMKTAINSYTVSSYIIEATLDCLLGRAPFKSLSPVEPFCGRKDLSF